MYPPFPVPSLLGSRNWNFYQGLYQILRLVKAPSLVYQSLPQRPSHTLGHSFPKTPPLQHSPLKLVLAIPLDCLELDLGQFYAGNNVLQFAIYLIPRLHRPDTGGRTGQDHITCLEERKRLTVRPGGCRS